MTPNGGLLREEEVFAISKWICGTNNVRSVDVEGGDTDSMSLTLMLWILYSGGGLGRRRPPLLNDRYCGRCPARLEDVSRQGACVQYKLLETGVLTLAGPGQHNMLLSLLTGKEVKNLMP